MHICMDWRSIKFDWNKARAFLVTAEEGSLSAAARALDMAQPTLGRQVTGLEQELGIVLFERVGRSLQLTPGGAELLDHVGSAIEIGPSLSFFKKTPWLSSLLCSVPGIKNLVVARRCRVVCIFVPSKLGCIINDLQQ